MKTWNVVLWSTDTATVEVEAEDEDAAIAAAQEAHVDFWKNQDFGVSLVEEVA